MNLRVIERRLRSDSSLPSEFEFFSWCCFPPGGPTIYVELRGKEVQPCKTGPRKGKPNWRKGANERVFNITIERARQIEAEYEIETGNCSACDGTAKELASASAAGATYRACGKCRGSGRAVAALAGAAP